MAGRAALKPEDILGRRIVRPVCSDLPAHFIRCPACRHQLDMGRLEEVLAHEERCGSQA